jgi:DNA-binding beta-propeller fold protein YncE
MLYDVTTGRVVYNGAPGLLKVYVPPMGRYVVLIRRGNVEWIDTATFESHGLLATVRTIIESLAVLPDGRVAVSEWLARKTSIWDPRTGQVTAAPSYVGTLSAAGPWVAGFDASQVLLMNPTTNEQRALLGQSRVLGDSITFMGGKPEEPTTLVSFAEGMARVWDLHRSAAVVWRLGRRLYAAPHALMEGGKSVLATAQDGRLFLRGLEPDAREVELAKLPARAFIIHAAPDGVHAYITTLDSRLLRIDVHTRELEVLATETPAFQRFVVSPDGKALLALSYEEMNAVLWNFETGKTTKYDTLRGRCEAVAIAPDSKTAVISCGVAHDRSYTRLDVATGAATEVAFPSSLAHIIGFTPSGRYFYGMTDAGELLRWDWSTMALERRHVHSSHGVTGLPLTDDLVISSGGEGLAVTMFSTGVSHALDRAPLVAHMTYQPRTGMLGGIVSGAGDRVGLWDLRTGETWNVPRFDANDDIDITADGRLVVAGFDGVLRVFVPPATLSATPAETRAWLGSLTSVTLDPDPSATASCE